MNDRSLAGVWHDVHRLLEDPEVPEGVAFLTGGEQEEINSSFKDLGWALLLSALLVYMILAAQFESFLDPLIISAVLPFGGRKQSGRGKGHGLEALDYCMEPKAVVVAAG